MVDLPLDKLGHQFLCHFHFEPKYFLATKLAAGAVPIPYKDAFAGKEIVTYSPTHNISIPSTSSATEIRFLTPEKVTEAAHVSTPTNLSKDGSYAEAIIDMPEQEKSERDRDTPRKTQLKRKLFATQRQLHNVQSSLKRKLFLTAPRSANQLTPFNRFFINMQLYHTVRSAWTLQEKNVALSFYYKSVSTYKFMRSKGCILPGPSTIRSWTTKFVSKPGHNKKLFKLLKLKTESMTSKQRQCVLLFDEMAIKSYIEFSKNKDLIEGFEDLGEFGRRSVPAKQVLVLMVRGLYSNWKIPLSFYFSRSGVAAHHLFQIIKSTLLNLNTIGLNPLAIICHQSSVNQRVFKLFEIIAEKPFYYLNDRRYFVFV